MSRFGSHVSLKPLSELMSTWARQNTQPTPPAAQSAPVLGTVAKANVALPQPDRLLQATQSPSQSARPELGFVRQPLIGPDDRVLHIGDSHTVGIYGKEMDQLLRATGAKVETYGSAGSSPSWWLNGHSTHSGFFSRDAEGHTVAPANWRDPHPTPKLPNLLQRFQPNVVVISLGANLIQASGQSIESQVHKLAQEAQKTGAKIIWVGPPDGRESKKPTSKQGALYEHLKQAASQYGAFIDSRPLTEYPEQGGDGLHYWGKEGGKIARSWAAEVFAQIQELEN